jgi:PAS domain S-box-containing protein
MRKQVSEQILKKVRGLEAQYSNSVVTLVSAEGDYLYMSGQIYDNGFVASEKIGRSFKDFVHPDDVAKIDEAMRAALICDRSFLIRVRVRTRDGYEYVDRISQRLIDDESGQFYLVNVATKVTADQPAVKQSIFEEL